MSSNAVLVLSTDEVLVLDINRHVGWRHVSWDLDVDLPQSDKTGRQPRILNIGVRHEIVINKDLRLLVGTVWATRICLPVRWQGIHQTLAGSIESNNRARLRGVTTVVRRIILIGRGKLTRSCGIGGKQTE